MRDWTAFEILLVISGLCGVLMVVGAMWLLRRRAITLESAGRDGTLSVELINKLKITTANPVLALFVVGLFFVLGPLLIARDPRETKRIILSGMITSDEGPVANQVTIVASSPPITILPQENQFRRQIATEMDSVVLQFSAPDYRLKQLEVDLSSRKGDEVRLDQPVRLHRLTQTAAPSPRLEHPAPAGVPPLESPGRF